MQQEISAHPIIHTLTMDVPSAFNNNLVAESDLEAACRVLRQEALSPALAEALIAHVKRIVQPISDEAFHLYKYQIRKEEEEILEKENTNNNLQQHSTKQGKSDAVVTHGVEDDTSHALQLDTADDDDDMLEDPEILIDTEAQERVKALRQQVREQATRLSTAREAVLERAANLAQKQVELLIGPALETSLSQSDYSGSSITEEEFHLIENLKDSLDQVMANMETTHALPSQIESFSHTLSVLQSFLHNRENNIEKAILKSPEPILPSYREVSDDPLEQLRRYVEG
jgi:hypothetical protein